jgi:hypothetical protein
MITVIDNFLPNPDEVRANALDRLFFWGNIKRVSYPGMRTKYSKQDQELRIRVINLVEKALNRKVWLSTTQAGSHAFTMGFEKTEKINWIHHDVANKLGKQEKALQGRAWAGVLYLTPNPPKHSGTALYEVDNEMGVQDVPVLSSSKEMLEDIYENAHTIVDNRYNRLVLYPANYWHAPMKSGFGKTKKDGRLIMNLFMVVSDE